MPNHPDCDFLVHYSYVFIKSKRKHSRIVVIITLMLEFRLGFFSYWFNPKCFVLFTSFAYSNKAREEVNGNKCNVNSFCREYKCLKSTYTVHRCNSTYTLRKMYNFLK